MQIIITYNKEEAEEVNKALEKCFIPTLETEKRSRLFSRHTYDGKEYTIEIQEEEIITGIYQTKIQYPKELPKVLTQKVLRSNKLQKRIRDVRDLFSYNYCPPDLYSDEDNYLPKYPRTKEDKEKAGYHSCIAESEDEKK